MTEDVSDELLVGRFKRWPTCKLEKKNKNSTFNAVMR